MFTCSLSFFFFNVFFRLIFSGHSNLIVFLLISNFNFEIQTVHIQAPNVVCFYLEQRCMKKCNDTSK
ncbi:hypothetical protein CEQ15_13730 [Chryseobacterium indologenes]|nr:hypothetical protein CEQ15_13730 [Chryseobacterium indologenes]